MRGAPSALLSAALYNKFSTTGRAVTMDGDFWDWLKVGGGVSAGFVGILGLLHFILKAASWAFGFIAGRKDVSHSQLMQLLNEVQEELAGYRDREKEFQAREADLLKRIATLEGIDMGIGALRENEQLVRSISARMDKLEEREK